MKKVFIRQGFNKRIENGYLWVFSNELIEVPKYPLGEIVEVFYNQKSYGLAFYNPNNLIACRLLKTHNKNIDELIHTRIEKAKKFREDIYKNEKTYRLVFGESDFLSGLIIDKYDDYFVIQLLSFGYENFKKSIINSLLKLYPSTKGILQKYNSKLSDFSKEIDEEILFGEIPKDILIDDKGIKIKINLLIGQKTGYFLDQRNNRHFLRNISSNKTVLDCFSNVGGFGLNALIGNAKKATFIDESKLAVSLLEDNLNLNNFENYEIICQEAFVALEKLIAEDYKFDIVILDPPAFAKNKKNLITAIAAYHKLNRLGIKLVNKGGYLITCSCSFYITKDDFKQILNKEILKSGKKARLIYDAGQSFDHPINPSMVETNYLKCLIYYID